MQRITKLSITTSFCILAAFLTVIPEFASGYQLSLYNHLPIPVLALAVGLTLISTWSTIILLSQGRHHQALAALTPALTIFALLPFLAHQLGYLTKYGDTITHAGRVMDISTTGHLPDVIYPGLHIITSVISQLTGLPAATALEGLNIVMVLVVIVATALIARELKSPSAAVLLFVPLIAWTNITPSTFTYSTLFLFCVYTLYRTIHKPPTTISRTHVSVLVVLFTFLAAIWIHHVVPAFVVTGILVVAVVDSQFHISNRLSQCIPAISPPNPDRLLSILLYTGLIGYMWMIYTWLFRRGVFLVYSLFGFEARDQFLGGRTVTQALFGTFGFTLVDVAILGMKRFGDYGIILGFAALGILCVAFVRSQRVSVAGQSVPLWLLVLVPFSAVWSLEEFVIGFIPSVHFLRALRPALFLAAPLAGIGLSYLIVQGRTTDQLRKQRLGSIIVAGLLMSSGVVVASANAYPSPWVVDKNPYFQESDIEGMGWYYEYKDRDIGTAPLWRSNDRYMDFLMRPTERADRRLELNYSTPTNKYRAPNHFGYPNNETFGEAVSCQYYVEGEFGKKIYLEVWSELDRFSPSDFQRLRTDPSVQQIYSNGNVELAIVGCG